MNRAQMVELGAGMGAIIFGIFLFAYIRKIKSRLRRFILRKGGE